MVGLEVTWEDGGRRSIAAFLGVTEGLWVRRLRSRRKKGAVSCALYANLLVGPVVSGWARQAIAEKNVRVQPMRKLSVSANMDAPPPATGKGGTLIVWLREELRIHDNPALSFAAEDASAVLVVYVFDQRVLRTSGRPPNQHSEARDGYLLESLNDLRSSLQSLGSDLALHEGRPEVVLPKLCKTNGARGVVYHRAVTKPGVETETKLKERLEEMNVESVRLWSNTMYQLEDTPFNLRTIPWEYEQFQKEVNAEGVVRKSLPPLKEFPKPPRTFATGDVPKWIRCRATDDSRLSGGENAALKQFQDRLDEVISGNKASKPWDLFMSFEHGCLSPRLVKERLKTVSDKFTPENLQVLDTELILWDFFRFISLVRAIMNIEAHLPKKSKSIIP